MQMIPHEGARVETGAVQFGDDWPGVFIRGDNAFALAMPLQALLNGRDDPLTRAQVGGLLSLLRSSNVHADARPLESQGTPTPAADEVEAGPFHVSRSSDGERQWFSARDPASGVSIPAADRNDAYALVSSLNEAFASYAKRAAIAALQARSAEPVKVVATFTEDGMGVRIKATEPATSAWIVSNGNADAWRTWENGAPEWTGDREKATRYSRRVDAEAVHAEDEDAWRVEPYDATPTNPERLVEALKPFARAAEWWTGFHDFQRITSHQHRDCLEVGHLRAAAAALSAAPLKEGEGE